MLDAITRITEQAAHILPIVALCMALGLAAKRSALWSSVGTGRREFSTNVGFWLIDAAILLPIIGLATGIALQPVPVSGPLVQFWNALPAWVVAVAAVIAGDLIGYFRHRLEHSRWLWPAHEVHHSDTAISWSTLYRMHPLNRLTTAGIDTFVLALCGFPPVALLVNYAVRNAWGTIIHADLPWSLGPFGKVIISPAAHRVHHAADERLAGSNFATVFTFWDRAFGTWRSPLGLEDCATGVRSVSRGLLGEMARPFESWANALFSVTAPQSRRS